MLKFGTVLVAFSHYLEALKKFTMIWRQLFHQIYRNEWDMCSLQTLGEHINEYLEFTFLGILKSVI